MALGCADWEGKWTLVWKYLFTWRRFFMTLFYGNWRNNFRRYLAMKSKKKDKPNLRKDLKVLHHIQFSPHAFIRDSSLEPGVLLMQDNVWSKDMAMARFEISNSPEWSQKSRLSVTQAKLLVEWRSSAFHTMHPAGTGSDTETLRGNFSTWPKKTSMKQLLCSFSSHSSSDS